MLIGNLSFVQFSNVVFSWKTFFLVELLKRTRTYLQPSPQRIIWLYKRWQPLYDVIKKSILLRVEFIKGIPLNLEKDDFLNTRVRNLIVLDDLATDASKDSRIPDLFTEGSHHRNLSVIALNQNLYFSKDPTQRRNCHYLILFNNPVDKQPVMTLARQMYPHNPRELLSHFQVAISQPYGSLLIDLKPTTPEALRMRTNIFDKTTSNDPTLFLPTNIKLTNTDNYVHSKESAQSVQFESKQNTSGNLLSCDDCGLVFDQGHALQNHVKRWCEEREGHSDEPPRKRMKFDSEEDNELFEHLMKENEVYKTLAKFARAHNEDKRQRKVEKYENEGLSTKKAIPKANHALRDEDVRAFLQKNMPACWVFSSNWETAISMTKL